MKRFLLASTALAFFGFTDHAFAQGCWPSNPNCIVPTAPAGTNDGRAASTAFVQNIPSAQLFNVTRSPFNADPTGVNANFGAAFNAAMTACRAGGPLGIANNGTVFIPPGFYKIGATGLVWSPGCSIWADPDAYIQANVSLTTMLRGNIGLSNSLIDLSLIGGQWDCNANVTDSGFALPDFQGIHLRDFRMYGCNGHTGNGSIGGFIRLGAASTANSLEIHITNCTLRNYISVVPTVVSGNYGIFTDPNSVVGAADSRFEGCEIVGTSIGIQGNYFDGIFDRMHVYNGITQGGLQNGLQLTSGQIRLIGNEVEGPIASGRAAYDLSGTATAPYTMLGNAYFEQTNNNISNGVNLAAGVALFSYGNHWIGTSGHTILTDYTGTLTGLNVLGDYSQFTTNVVGGAWKAYTPGLACGSATFTVNSAKANTSLQKTTTAQLDFTIATLGTCTSVFFFSLPNTANSGGGLVGRDSVSTGGNITCFIGTGTATGSCSSSSPLTGTSRVILSGVYENQ